MNPQPSVLEASHDPLLSFKPEAAILEIRDAEDVHVHASMAPHDRDATASVHSGAASRVRPWWPVSISLVVGMAIGFASGYTVVERFAERRPVAAEVSEPPDSAARQAGGSPQSESSADAARGVASTDSELAAVSPAHPVTGLYSPPAHSGARVEAQFAPEHGSLEIVSRPSGAQVSLDGFVVGHTPLSLPHVRSGPYDVEIDLPGYNRWVTSVVVTAGNRTRVGASLDP